MARRQMSVYARGDDAKEEPERAARRSKGFAVASLSYRLLRHAARGREGGDA